MKTFILLILMIDSQGNENLDVVNNMKIQTMKVLTNENNLFR